MVVLFDSIDLPMVVVLVPLLVILLYIYGTYPYSFWKQLDYIDGPRPSPFIGNLAAMFDPAKGTRQCIKEWQEKYGRMIPTYWFRDPVLVVSDPVAVREIMVKDFNKWADRYLTGGGDMQQKIIKKGLFFTDSVDWRRIRKIMSPTFSSGKLKLVTHYMNLTSARLADKLEEYVLESKPVIAKTVFGTFALDVICGIALGLDTNFQNDHNAILLKHVRSLMSFERDAQLRMTLVGFFPFIGKIFKSIGIGYFRYKDVNFLENYISQLVELRRKGEAKHADFLQLLLNAEANEGDEIDGERMLKAEEITAQGIIFLIAGYDTTSSAMQFLIYELSRNQDVQEKLREEIKATIGDMDELSVDNLRNLRYTEAALYEILRMYPPFFLLSRQAVEDTTLKDLPVPKGTAVIIPAFNIGRDPEFYPDPDTFKPERFLGENSQDIDTVTFLPFGFGPRQCIGMRLALMEMKVALVHVLRRVKIAGTTPNTLELDDYSGVLMPRVPIQMHLELLSTHSS